MASTWKLEPNLRLTYKQYLPRWFRPSLLGSWVSPSMINWNNATYDADQFNVVRRLSKTPAKMSYSTVISEAFNEKWFGWKFVNIGQIHYYEDIKDTDTWKILMFKFRLSIFEGSSNYRRLLAIIAIAEYFSKRFAKKRVKIVFYVFSDKPKAKSPLFNKWSAKYDSFYAELQTFSFLGSVTILSKLVSLAHAQQKL